MFALAAPVLGMKLPDMGRETHSRSITAMQTFDRLNAVFPELKSMHQVVVCADADRSPEVTAALRNLAKEVEGDPRTYAMVVAVERGLLVRPARDA